MNPYQPPTSSEKRFDLLSINLPRAHSVLLLIEAVWAWSIGFQTVALAFLAAAFVAARRT